MSSILEGLFTGNLSIMENLTFRKLHLSSDEEKDEIEFISTLTEEQRQLYEKIQNSFMNRCSIGCGDCFTIGFKMAVRIILESLSDTDNPLI